MISNVNEPISNLSIIRKKFIPLDNKNDIELNFQSDFTVTYFEQII